MPVFVVDPASIHEFKTAAALHAWYRRNHARADELWLKVHKTGSGLKSVTIKEALDEALCWGWIDAIRKSFDEQSYLQRYTRRKKTSTWSKVNIGHIARLREAGRMQPSGEAEVTRAQQDGRWAAAYGSFKDDEFPADLLAAIKAEPAALEMLGQLSAQNRFAMAFRVHKLKTAEARARKVAEFVAMLQRGETIYPNGKGK